ncbi:MAG: class I adenylate cyclase [Deltaproteobacteria bacterium]|nr:class I adenylate cyclase [Deltaproteobacteria bacterium]
MLLNTFAHNKKIYLAYNEYRKRIFSELAPRDSAAILYLLPWMLSVNDRAVPGYMDGLEKPVTVFGAATDPALLARESTFKKRFNIRKQAPLMTSSAEASIIQGIYTIGSVGTIGQTPSSDCDIWICIDKNNFDDGARTRLSQKVNLIKDWMDSNLKMPVYFFICDIDDIRRGNFGSLDDESSGSAQHNVLKEEFYRTSILISGKIPLWWICFDPGVDTDYEEFAAQYAKDIFGDYDCIDMGPLPTIDRDEYFGAALWQFNKALTHPLKSVIKMLLLEMLLGAPREELLCHRFRNLILNQQKNPVFYDPSVFTWKAILEYKRGTDFETFAFVQKCYYLRHEIKFYSKKETIRESIGREIFQTYPLEKAEIHHLNDFAAWPLSEQLDFGENILRLLKLIYNEITPKQKETASRLTRRDMTIIGRKLAVCLEKKQDKIPVIRTPSANLNLPGLTFSSKPGGWQVLASGDSPKPVTASSDITYCIAYLVWNDLFHALDVRMAPNPTPVTLQEIHNLAKRIKEIFGSFDITGIDFKNFLEPEKVTKMLVIVSFESPSHLKDMNDFSVLYCSNWGELFFRRFNSPEKFKAFIKDSGRKFSGMDMCYYVRRNSLYFEKIIERTKMLVTQIFAGLST